MCYYLYRLLLLLQNITYIHYIKQIYQSILIRMEIHSVYSFFNKSNNHINITNNI